MNRSNTSFVGVGRRIWTGGWHCGAILSFAILSQVYAQEPPAGGAAPVPAAAQKPPADDAPVSEAVSESKPEAKDPLQKLWDIQPLLEAEAAVAPETVPEAIPAVPVTTPAGPVEAARKGATSELNRTRKDPLVRTGLTNAQTNAEMVSEGVVGMSVEDSVFLPAKVTQPGAGVILGPSLLYPTLRSGSTYRHTTGARADSSENGFHPTVGAGLDLSLGEAELRRTLRLIYSGQYEYLSEDSNRRPFTQQLAVRGDFAFAKLGLGFGISYAGLSGANRDFGGDVERDFLTLALTATTELTPKSSLDWDISIPVRRYSGGYNSAGVTSTTFVNFNYSPKTQIGVGFSAGTQETEASDAQQFVQLLGRANLASSEIYSFFGTFGVEFRQTGGEDKVNPIFGLGATWNPRLGTSVSLSAENRVQSSGSRAGSDYMTTSAAVSVGQRLGSRMSMSFTCGYENAQYFSSGATTGAERHDQALFGAIGVQAVLSPRWQAAINYSYRDTKSNESPFTDSVAQLQLSFVY